MSYANLLEFPPLVCERQHSIELFQTFLHKYFRNPEHVAVAFDVRFTTACNWWNGTNLAGGVPVLKAMGDDRFVEMVRGAA